jgi:hypothetical protein
MDMNKEWAKYQAELIIQEHVHAVMCSTSDYDPKGEEELKDFMLSECAHIVTDKLLKGAYTPLEYNAVRNATTALIYGLFAVPNSDDEEDADVTSVYANKAVA